MSLARTIARNVFSNAAGFFVNIAVGILLSPFVADQLGTAGFGFWNLLISCTGSYGLLDIGIRSAVGQYVTRYWAKGDVDGVSRTLSTAAVLMGFGGLAVLLLGGVVTVVGPWIFHLDGVDDGTARTLFAIVAGGVAINFPLMIAQAATYARSRFDIATGIAIFERLSFAALAVWVLVEDHGLIGLAIANAASQTAANLARVIAAKRLLPGATVARRFFERSSVRELYGYSVFSVMINAGDQVLIHAASLIIPMLVGASSLALYGVGANLVGYMLALVSTIAWTLTPHATASDARGDLQSVRALWIRGSRPILAFAAVIGGGIVFVGSDFIAAWMGPDYAAGIARAKDGVTQIGTFTPSPWIASILVFGALARAAMTVGRQICFGLREVRPLARLSFAEAGLLIVLGFVLCAAFGEIGVAIASVTATAIVQLWYLPRFLSRRLDVPLSSFYASIPTAPVAVFATLFVIHLALDARLPHDTWNAVLVKAPIYGIPGLVAAFAFGTTRDEKQAILARLRLRGRSA